MGSPLRAALRSAPPGARGRRLLPLAALLALAAAPLAAPAARGEETRPRPAIDIAEPERLVAIGDVHGDHATFLRVLRAAKLIDARGAWSGGEAVFIQTGDLLDRGPRSREVLDFLMRLEGEAAAAGGRVIVLLGNHEVFNLIGDLRYLHPRELAPYARDETPEERRGDLAAVLDLLARPDPALRGDHYRRLGESLRRAGAEKAFPAGFFAHRRLLGPEGRYGKWLLGKPVAVKAGRTLFVHGGLGPRFGRIPIEELRRRFAADLEEYFRITGELARRRAYHPALGVGALYGLIAAEKAAGGPAPELRPHLEKLERLLAESLVFAEDGPIWYRGLAEAAEAALEADLEAILRAQDADRLVIGHTQPAENRITSRFAGRVTLIDTGLNQEVYRGSPQALEMLQGGKIEVISPP